jgi:ABC-type branched-subunit amino acid transport system ATPase component
LVVILADVKLPSEMKTTGSAKGVFPFVAKYYVDQADRLYHVPGIPDFKNIEYFLNQARVYAVTPELEKEVSSRLTAIDFSVLLNKAEIAIQSGTPEDLEAAMGYLGEAKRLDLDEAQAQLIANKTNDVRSRIASLETE